MLLQYSIRHAHYGFIGQRRLKVLKGVKGENALHKGTDLETPNIGVGLLKTVAVAYEG